MTRPPGTLTVYDQIEQRTPEWYEQRRGIITASMIGRLITTSAPDAMCYRCPDCDATPQRPCMSKAAKEPKPIKTVHSQRTEVAARRAATASPIIRPASNETSRGIIASLAAERITGIVEESPMTDAMWRGIEEEPYAVEAYEAHTQTIVLTCGFTVREFDGIRVGYSPDGLIGNDGLLEVKARGQKTQVTTITSGRIPAINMAQLQTGLWVTGRPWIDYGSYSNGMHYWTRRVTPDPAWFDAIEATARQAEHDIQALVDTYHRNVEGLLLTERRDTYNTELIL